MKQIKVAKSWWNKFDARQQEYFIQRYDKVGTQRLRKFLTAAKQKFGQDVIYKPCLIVESNGKQYTYNSDFNVFSELNLK